MLRIDQARIDLAQSLVVDAEPELHVGAEILHHDVGVLHHPLEDRDALRRLEIERHAALVAVQILEVAGRRAGRPSARRSQLGGASILMTRAPQSASWRTQVGPARTRVRSSTLKRESALEARGNGTASTSRMSTQGRIASGQNFPDPTRLVHRTPARPMVVHEVAIR